MAWASSPCVAVPRDFRRYSAESARAQRQHSPRNRIAFMRMLIPLLCCVISALPRAPAHADPLPDTTPLTTDRDLALQMVDGIDRWLARETASALANRPALWHRDLSSPQAYERSIAPQREHL